MMMLTSKRMVFVVFSLFLVLVLLMPGCVPTSEPSTPASPPVTTPETAPKPAIQEASTPTSPVSETPVPEPVPSSPVEPATVPEPEQVTAPQPAPETPAPEPQQASKPYVASSPSAGSTATFEITKAPKVGEPVDLTFTLDLHGGSKGFSKVWLEFERYDPAVYYPLGGGHDKIRMLKEIAEKADSQDYNYVYYREMAKIQPEARVPLERVVVSGEASWEGEPLRKGDVVRITATVSFPEEGNWIVSAWLEGGSTPRDELRLTVNQESGMIGWPEDYASLEGGYFTPTDWDPTFAIMKPSRLPLFVEPFNLTITMKSVKDLEEAEVSIKLYHFANREYTQVPIEEVVTGGNIPWKGSLKKDVPLDIGCTILFPLEGSWKLMCFTRASPEMRITYREVMFFYIGTTRSRFGWPEPSISNSSFNTEANQFYAMERGELTVEGTVQYYNRGTPGGTPYCLLCLYKLVGSSWIPISSFGPPGWSHTYYNGNFSITVNNPYTDMALRVYTYYQSSWDPPNEKIMVVHKNGTGYEQSYEYLFTLGSHLDDDVWNVGNKVVPNWWTIADAFWIKKYRSG